MTQDSPSRQSSGSCSPSFSKKRASNLSKLKFDGDYKRVVTQAHLGERREKVEQCVSRLVRGAKIPAGHEQSGTEGKIRIALW